jgi:rod shape-determining protein MreD
MKNVIEFLLWFVGLVLLQVLLLNNIKIAGVINPFLYVYLIIALPIHTNRISLIFTGFALGMVIDVFSNSWGIHAMATTLIAFLRPYVLRVVSTQEEMDKVMPRFRTMGVNYLKYIVLMVFVHHLMLFTLEAFSFHYFWIVLSKTLVSSIISIILILTLEKIRK